MPTAGCPIGTRANMRATADGAWFVGVGSAMPTKADELAERLILLAALRKRIAALETETKDQLHQAISPGTTLKPTLASDGKPVGRVSYTVNRTTARVTNEPEWSDWVLEHYPEHTEMVIRVDERLTARALALSEETGMPVGPGGECGPDGPAGISVAESGGYIAAYPDKTRMPELWAEINNRLPELTEGHE